MGSFVKHEPIITEKKYFFEEIFIQSFYVRLRFKRDIKFLFYHGSKIYGLIAKILDLHPTEKEQRNINDIVINPCEYGRIYYNTGDEYCFGITFLKDGYDFENKIKSYFPRERDKSSTSDFGFSNDLTNSSVELVEIKELSNQIELQPSYSSNIHTLNFVTPLRIERTKEEKVKGGSLFDISHFNFQRFLYILYKRIENLYKLNFESEPSFEIPSIPTAEIIEKNFIWIEMPKKEQKRNTGGIVGNIKFKCELGDFWLRLIQLGQFFHAGKSTSAGFGKYIFNNCYSSALCINPVKSFMDLILDKENLLTAFKHIKENSDFAGVDNVTPDFYESNLDKNLEYLTESVINGSYKSSELKGIIIPKSENKIRALAIPTVQDRTLQRAVSQVLSPSIDEMLEDNSFAYRKGYSRSSAAYAINQARKDGFNFILESDIQSFFDNVNWEILINKLKILYGNDPLFPILLQWITSDVIFNEKRIKRTKGLPQGAVISPLLANLYLDEFDEALQNDFKLIRYADDFVILCKSKEQAEEALSKVKETLQKIDLEIKPSKTSIISFEDGFQYLGYLFVNSLIIDKSSDDAEQQSQPINFELDKDSLPQGSWLTFANLSNIRNIKRKPEINLKPLNTNEIQEILLDKFPLYITNFSSLHIENGNLDILTEEENSDLKKLQFPLTQVSSLVFIGYSKVSMPAVFKLNENNIPVFFCKPNGEIRLQINPNIPNYELWLEQSELAQNDFFKTALAKEIVQAKINNQKVVIRRINNDETTINKFNYWIDKAAETESLESLRGIEGSAASFYFDKINDSLEEDWKFNSRTKHPPEDPFNSLLSFGYSILYHHISTALIIEGLNPQIGFFHQPSNRYNPLASDIQEEFRHIIDSLAIYITHRNMVSLNDFVFDEKNTYPCMMTKEFRKKYIGMIEERLKTEFTPADFNKKVTYKQFINYQVKVIKNCIRKKEMSYKPLKIR